MQQHDTPLETSRFYHIYNRGINGENIFLQENNYYYFLEKYAFFMHPVVETYAYSLLRNHFHLLIRVKNQELLEQFARNSNSIISSEGKGLHSINHIVSKQFARFFSSYTQSFNKVYKRTGSLVETPFKRKEVNSEEYFTRMVFYIHHNPQKHGFVKDFRDYLYSSYHSYLSSKQTKLEREKVLEWFGGEQEYTFFHQTSHNLLDIQDLVLEFD
jgi:putative transposase